MEIANIRQNRHLTEHISILARIQTYKDEPSAHGRCELEARRSVHPERM